MIEPYFVFYQSAMILSLLTSLFVMAVMWQWRQAPGAGAMLVLVVSTFIWTLGYLVEANSDTLGQQLLFCRVGYIGMMSAPVAWFLFALRYTNDKRLLPGWQILSLCVVPLAAVSLVWTNDWHHLMWSDERLIASGPFTVTAKTYGPLLWIAVAYCYVLIVAGAVILMRRLFVGTPLYTRQAVSLVVAVALPLIWNLIFVFDLLPLPRKDLTPVMFSISGVAIALGLMRFQLFTAVPFALRFLVHQLRDGVLVFDMGNRLLEANPSALKTVGMDTSIIGKDMEDLHPLSAVFERLSSIGSGSVELPLTASGEERICELEAVPMRDSRNRQVGWLAVLHDITERKKIHEQLATQDRLASMGEFTAGIAHELNNPLSNVIGYSELMLKRDLPADVAEDVRVINNEAERAARIVDGLLTFARTQHGDESPIDINETIEKTLELRAHDQVANNIQTFTRFAASLPEVMGSDFQLRQVFLNVIINAESSMIEANGKGTLTIVTERTGDFIRVSFTDDGPGIPQQNLARLFDPFFTTKEVGKGTGLGLSICHGIVAEHGGRIWAESGPGEGATLSIELPVMDRAAIGGEWPGP